MSARLVVGKVLAWTGIVLGVPSAGSTLFFGIDAVPILLRPDPPRAAPLDPNAHPLEVAARGVSAGAQLLGAVADGIAVGLFLASLGVLAVAGLLYFVGRRLRGSTQTIPG